MDAEAVNHVGMPHNDAKNMKLVLQDDRHVIIASTKSGARLEIHFLSLGRFLVRVHLEWGSLDRMDLEYGFSVDDLRHAFNIGEDDELMFGSGPKFYRLEDHLTVPARKGAVLDFMPYISVKIDREMRSAVRQLLAAQLQMLC